MIQVETKADYNQYPNHSVLRTLNRNRIGKQPKSKVVKAMGLAACQGLCITYHLHSKAFCK